MNLLGLCVCEICGTQSADHAGWFALAGAGNRIEILPWQDDLRVRPDCRHACCSDHLQQLIFSTAAREFSQPALPLTLHRGGWHPSSLVPATDAKAARSNEDAILSVLNEIDSVLQGPTADEEDGPNAFDA